MVANMFGSKAIVSRNARLINGFPDIGKKPHVAGFG
jgi:hypothetical protein